MHDGSVFFVENDRTIKLYVPDGEAPMPVNVDRLLKTNQQHLKVSQARSDCNQQ